MPITPPNSGVIKSGGHVGHSSRPPKGPGPSGGIRPANEGIRFDAETSKMPQPQSQIGFGKGMVPVNPWDASGSPAKSAAIPDDADLKIPRGR